MSRASADGCQHTGIIDPMSGSTRDADPKPRFFSSVEAMRAWLEKNHARATALWVGYYKKGATKRGVTYPESVDAALCYGWIDGVRHSIDSERYMNRFTPRKKNSNWSAVNLRRIEELTRLGLMRPPGIAAYEARDPARTQQYAFEQREEAALAPPELRQFKANRAAWKFFQSMAPWYRRTALHWVVSVKRPETRARRLATLIEDCAAGRTIKPLTRPEKRGAAP
jgi:uncharacterized protein YdeI (YjbR/CyaY-like superfamily)